jgi:hypothetical protein
MRAAGPPVRVACWPCLGLCRRGRGASTAPVSLLRDTHRPRSRGAGPTHAMMSGASHAPTRVRPAGPSRLLALCLSVISRWAASVPLCFSLSHAHTRSSLDFRTDTSVCLSVISRWAASVSLSMGCVRLSLSMDCIRLSRSGLHPSLCFSLSHTNTLSSLNFSCSPCSSTCSVHAGTRPSLRCESANGSLSMGCVRRSLFLSLTHPHSLPAPLRI